MSKTIRAFLAAALLGLPAAALAEAVEEKNLVSGKEKLDPESGYIFVQAPNRTFGLFFHEPDDQTRAEYQQDWNEAFEKARKKYPRTMEIWRSKVEIAKKTKEDPPPQPVEPTPENFTISPIELRDSVSFGPMFVFNKEKDDSRFTYLSKVKPGTYIYYGPMLMQPGMAAGGLCYCMGTVSFEVKPGVITDLGNFLLAAPVVSPPFDVGTQLAMENAEERKAKGKDVASPPSLAFGVPDSLKGLPAVEAEFHAHGKLNNYYAVVVSRIPPIPGVLHYNRDTVIDERTGQAVPNPPIVTQVKIKK